MYVTADVSVHHLADATPALPILAKKKGQRKHDIFSSWTYLSIYKRQRMKEVHCCCSKKLRSQYASAFAQFYEAKRLQIDPAVCTYLAVFRGRGVHPTSAPCAELRRPRPPPRRLRRGPCEGS